MAICENCGRLLLSGTHLINGETYRCQKVGRDVEEDNFEQPSGSDVSYSVKALEAPKSDNVRECWNCGEALARYPDQDPLKSPSWKHAATGLLGCTPKGEYAPQTFAKTTPDNELPIAQISELAIFTIISEVDIEIKWIKVAENKWGDLDYHCTDCQIFKDDEAFKGKKIEFHAIGVDKG